MQYYLEKENKGVKRMQVGCYVLDLYCDNTKIDFEEDMKIHSFNQFPHTYTAEFGSTCRREARERGWTINKDKIICPECNSIKELKK